MDEKIIKKAKVTQLSKVDKKGYLKYHVFCHCGYDLGYFIGRISNWSCHCPACNNLYNVSFD